MTKSWRPEGWKCPYEPCLEEGGAYFYDDVYEAGADAILEALKRRGTTQRQLGKDGWLVFFPDDEENYD